jgi:uncharacterized membrane protein YgcG
MAFSANGALRGGAEWACRQGAVYAVLRNPVVTGLLLTAVTLVILFAVFRRELAEAPWELKTKTGVWVLLATSLLLYVHYYALERCHAERAAQGGVRGVVAAVHQSATGGGGYAIPVSSGPGPGPSESPPRPAPRAESARSGAELREGSEASRGLESGGSGSGSSAGSEGSGGSSYGDGRPPLRLQQAVLESAPRRRR